MSWRRFRGPSPGSGTAVRVPRRPPLLGERAAEVKAGAAPGGSEPRRADSRPALEGLRVCDFSGCTHLMQPTGSWPTGTPPHRGGKHAFQVALRTGHPFKDGVVGPERFDGFCNCTWESWGWPRPFQARGLQCASAVATWADVVVENFSPRACRPGDSTPRHFQRATPG